MYKKDKIVFISKLLLFTEKDELIEKNLKILDDFSSNNIKLTILARNSTITKLKAKIPENYLNKIYFLPRDGDSKKQVLNADRNKYLFGLIGVVNHDAYFSFNSKVPLFNPERLIESNIVVSEKITKYGLPIQSYQEVIDCFNAYDIHKESYFHMNNHKSFTVIGLNNANTYYKPKNERKIKEVFERNLKGDMSKIDQRILLLLLFSLINEVTTNSAFEKVDYWGVFPSSNSQKIDTPVNFIKEAVRVLVNGKPTNGLDILLRKKSMLPKHNTVSQDRLNNKSEKDFETLIINPELINDINGKVICIIDDYITNGYSAEATKHLLLKAGAKEIIFVAFGKFGTKYYSTEYSIDGLVDSTYSVNYITETVCDKNTNSWNHYNPNNDLEILEFEKLLS